MRWWTDTLPAAVAVEAGPSAVAGAELPVHYQQKDSLCGPFHGARVLRAAGITAAEGEPLDQDLVALRAGTTLPEPAVGPQVPPGALSWCEYRFELPRVRQELAGTSAPGLATAIEQLSGGRLACVPLSGEWSAETVEGLLDRLAHCAARLIANLRTGRLWGSRPPLEALLAVLEGDEVQSQPAADWDVGHFVELATLLRGRCGTLVLVRDSYPSLGWAGVHLQPPATLAAALMRGDGREGGVLAVVSPDRAPEVRELAGGLGLEIRMWDNSGQEEATDGDSGGPDSHRRGRARRMA